MARQSERNLVRVSLADQVTEAVRDMIIVGELLPGQKVTHEELANRLGVSTMPVREALLRLTHEGIVVTSPGRFFEVAVTTRQDIDDVFWAVAVLEGELTVRAAKNADDDFVGRLRSIQHSWETLPKLPIDNFERLNVEFRNLINAQARSPKLVVLFQNAFKLIPLVPERYHAQLPAWRELSGTGHQAMLEAIEARDYDRVRQVAEGHVLGMGVLAKQLFSERGYWAEPDDDPSASR